MKNHYLLFVLFGSALLHSLPVFAALPGLAIGGQQLNLGEVVQTLDEARKEGRREFERQSASLNKDIDRHEAELTRLARDRQANLIGQLEYETRVKQIERKIQNRQREVDTMHKHADKVGEIITSVVSQGADVVMTTLREDATRKTQIAVAAAGAAARQEVENRGSLERLQLLTSADTLKRVGLTVGLAGGGLIASWYGGKLAYRWLAQFIGMPPVVQETSDKGLILGMLKTVKEWFPFGSYKEELPIFDNIIFPNEEVANAAARIILSTVHAKKYKSPQRGAIFYGPPGTGKTLLARTIARKSNVGYAIISGSVLAELKDGSTQFEQLFNRAELEAERDGCFMIVIDEADSFLGTRNSTNGRTLINSYLGRTGGKSKVKVFLITNDLHYLDAAVLDRGAEEVFIPLPGQQAREQILNLYLGAYYGQGNAAGFTVAPEVNENYMQSLAAQLDGFSGRKLEDVMGLVQDQMALSQQKLVTPAIIDQAAAEKIRQRDRAQAYEFKHAAAAAG